MNGKGIRLGRVAIGIGLAISLFCPHHNNAITDFFTGFFLSIGIISIIGKNYICRFKQKLGFSKN